jgi:hypothetical protein
MFVASGNSITAITPDGDVLRDWAFSPPDQQEPHSVRDIAVAADGRVFALVELSPGEEPSEEPVEVPAGFKPLGGGGHRLSDPIALDVAPDGTVSILDANGSIKRFASNGGFIEWLSRDALDTGDVAGASDGSLYVLDSADWRIETYALDGAFVLQWGQSGGGAGELIAPTAIAVGPDGSVYVADEGDGRVQRFTADGDFLAEWVVDDPAMVVDLSVGPAGVVYVASNRTATVDAQHDLSDLLAQVIDQDHRAFVLAAELLKVGKDIGHLAGVILVGTVHPRQRVENDQLGFMLTHHLVKDLARRGGVDAKPLADREPERHVVVEQVAGIQECEPRLQPAGVGLFINIEDWSLVHGKMPQLWLS